MPAGLNFAGFHSILAQCIQQWCRPNAFHCRCLLIPLLDTSFQFIWDGLPASCDLCKAQSLVCEISTVPPLWRARFEVGTGSDVWFQVNVLRCVFRASLLFALFSERLQLFSTECATSTLALLRC